MKQTISQRKALAMGKSVKLRGGGMVKKTGVKRFSGGGQVNLGRGGPEYSNQHDYVKAATKKFDKHVEDWNKFKTAFISKRSKKD